MGVDGSHSLFQQRELLSEFDESYHNDIALKYLSPLQTQRDVRDAGGWRAWLRQFRQRFLPHLNAGQRRRSDPAVVASLRAWAATRAVVMLPNRKIQRVEFRWFNETVSASQYSPRVTRESLGEFIVSLADDQPR